ncbi:isoprenylcysteine carboxylmethyltransferase family protein [Blastococcus sp. TF02A-35]|uniref:methyltransferase family protein n=1 Tax=Blastococcus sp. TF02A-35 TaxID=2559612 RepID=UPI0010746DF0|nr:isoprenylcysteine carboxylmethyltransferase family protein [Blastococcus sp. TF02A_35]TFV45439.1 isoprenylcysteine carboxylmethyltransferase family protein [Blastococcus sp. TF02A_35]
MSVVALVLQLAALVVLFGVRSWVQHRRTGSTGFRGISGSPREPGWWGGVLFVAAIVLGVAGPLLAVTGTVPADPHPVAAAAGLVLAVGGFLATLAGQAGMGASWRIGVDDAERTELVTSGVFAHVRNPIFTAMVLAQAGMVLLVPSWVGAAALLALVVAVQLQVRAVEEPYLSRVHGRTYAGYAARTGRFLPRAGRPSRGRSADRRPGTTETLAR